MNYGNLFVEFCCTFGYLNSFLLFFIAIEIAIKFLNRNIERDSGSFIWDGIKENAAVDVLDSFFHKK